ncbi:hypothetical protein BHM03_00047006 [Ensete ventricosum]|nr:hypothetical protein BHM03_00047006 [Ensete ventricosum]
MAAKRSGSEGSSDDGGRRGQQQHWLRLRCDFVVVGGVGCSKGAAIILRDFRLPSKNGEGERFSVRASFSLRCFSQGKLIAFPYTCALLVLVLCLRLHLRSTLGMAASFLTERRAGSVWKGGGFFSPRRRTTSRTRNNGGYAAIGVGFTDALQSYGKSRVERVTAASAIGDSGVGRVVASSPLGSWRSLGYSARRCSPKGMVVSEISSGKYVKRKVAPGGQISKRDKS